MAKTSLTEVTTRLEQLWIDPKTSPDDRTKAGKAIAAASGPKRLFELVISDPASTEADRKRAHAVLAAADKPTPKKPAHRDETGDGISKEDLADARRDMSEAESRQLAALQARIEHDGRPHVHAFTDAMGNRCVGVRN